MGETAIMPAPPRPHSASTGGEPTSGEEAFFRIDVRPREGFEEFRREPLDEASVERIDGRRAGGAWETQAWLIGKRRAHIEGDRLIPDSDVARRVLDDLDSVPEHIGGDVFRAKLRRSLSNKERNERARKFAQRMALEKNAARKPGSR